MNNCNLPPIYGMNECSEMGDKIFAPSIFLAGCNFCCPYCMNSKLISPCPKDVPTISLNRVRKYVEDHDCKWLMISGGEPTCTAEELLLNLILEIKSWGCRVGLGTNGSHSDKLKALLPSLDYVALDIKSSQFEDFEKHSEMALTRNIICSKTALVLERARHPEFSYEIRTTLFPTLVNKKSIRQIGSIMREDEPWVLQQYRHAPDMPDPACKETEPYSEEEIQEMLTIANRYVDNATLRYI